jgi:hypothetical protein
MAQFIFPPDQVPVEEQIKTLCDEELLDFWEETQYLEKFLEEEPGGLLEYSVECERIILKELQLRTCRRSLPAR